MSAVLNQERRRAGRASRPPQRRQILTPAETRTLVRVGFRTSGVLVAISATVVLVTLVSVNSELTGTFGAIASLWFAVHQVPFSISGTSLGVFPLLPTLVLLVVVARGIARTVTADSNRRECVSVAGAAVLGPLVVTALALAVSTDASAAIGLESPQALVAFAWVAGIHAVAALVGLTIGTWHGETQIERVPEWVREVVRPVVRASSVLVAGSGAIVLVAMLASWSTIQMLLDAGNGVVGVVGLTILSILYLPNVVIGSLAVAVGSSAHVGDVSVSMFRSVGGPLPPLPVLGVLPDGPSQTFWAVMLVVPVVAGIFLGRDCARRTVDVHYALSSVWLGAATVGVATLLVGFAVGGNLGTFGTVQVTVWSLGLLAFAWLAVVGSIAAAVTAWRGGSKYVDTESAPTPEPREPVAALEPADQGVRIREERAVEAEVVDEADVVEEAEVVQEPVDAEVVAAAESEEHAAPVDAEIVDAETTEDLPEKSENGND